MPHHAKRITVCGRVHLGPVCVNGGLRGGPICEACGQYVSRADRDLIQRMWNTVHAMLKKHRNKERK